MIILLKAYCQSEVQSGESKESKGDEQGLLSWGWSRKVMISFII
jgi:hypothetical protein